MKKKFKAKKPKKTFKLWKKIFLVLLFGGSTFVTIRLLAHFKLNHSNEDFLRFMLENQNVFVEDTKSNSSYFQDIMNKLIHFDLKNPITILSQNYKGLTSQDIVALKEEEQQEVLKNPHPENTVTEPNIYIYNTHQSENYKATSFLEYSVEPNVMMVDYLLKEQLEKNGHQVLVEEGSIYDVRASLGLNYAGSYQASRVLMEEAKANYSSLTYFIDVHRDSLTHDRTTITYEGETYASILFIVGLENPNYQVNLDFTTRIHDGLNSKINGLSKGIYKKEGEGVNGVYNQDFSARTILIEIGGPENTIDEVYRTTLILSEVLNEVIQND